YDQDDLFESGEKLGEFTTNQGFQSQGINFTVPVGAVTGSTTLRVRGVYHNTGEPSPTDPCYNYGFGETEDYGITIVPVGGSGACIPTSEVGTEEGDFINSVSLESIANVNSGDPQGPTYNDYTMYSTPLLRGIEYSIIIEGGEYAPDNYAAWIDMNGDENFTLNEKLGEFETSESFQAEEITFTLSNSATLGATTLRVRGVYHDEGEPVPTDPCFAYTYGETEDYTVVIEQITGIDRSALGSIGIYPNPAIDHLTIQRKSDSIAF
ncbi:MAG: GEVED domain-containing protein, partial [Bacteroidota bacterium]|nr:GEVED domain-containing protein [Bacteroidota bacterium]